MGVFTKNNMIPEEYFNKVKKHFNGSNDKAWEWFKSQHYQFGMLSPLNMIKLGRDKKVRDFIDKNMS